MSPDVLEWRLLDRKARCVTGVSIADHSSSCCCCCAGRRTDRCASPPRTTDASEGAALFRSDWAGCHGPSGTGGRGSDLTRGTFRHASDDGKLFRIIATGISGSPMPGVIATRPATSVWQLVAYVRVLNRQSSHAEMGDATAGRQLFEGRGRCSTCHRADTRAGPDLSNVALARSPAARRQVLVAPSDGAQKPSQMLRVIETTGAVHVGQLMDEDTFSVRLLENDRTLCAFDRKRLKSIERIAVRAAPHGGVAFTAREIDNVVAYLLTRRS